MWLRKKRILELWWLMKNKTSGRLGQQWCITHTMANTSSQPITLPIFRSTDFDSEVSLENELCGLKPAAPVRSSCIDDPLFKKVSSFFFCEAKLLRVSRSRLLSILRGAFVSVAEMRIFWEYSWKCHSSAADTCCLGSWEVRQLT